MFGCDLENSVPDWIIEHPRTLSVFQSFGIDTSCGGRSLAYACHRAGLDATLVLAKLYEMLDAEGRESV